MKKKTRRILWIFVTLFVLAGIVVAGGWFWQQRVAATNIPQQTEIVTAFIGELSSHTNASGKLLPQRKVQLALGTTGQVEQVQVKVGDHVQTGDILVQLDSDALGRAVRSAEQNLMIQETNLAGLFKGAEKTDLIAARATIASAQATLDDLLAGPSEKEIAQAEAALRGAQAGLRAAATHYEALDDQLLVAENDISNAFNAVERARWAHEAIMLRNWKAATSWGPYTPQAGAYRTAQINHQAAIARYNLTKLDINNSGYRAAQAQVARAEATLAALTKEKTVQIAATRAQLVQAKVRLDSLLDGTSQEQITIAEAQVQRAKIALQGAQDRLENATLTAPFDGVVTKVYLTVGEWASGLAVELLDNSSLKVVLDVDEIDIGSLHLGQEAIITLETWPDVELTGELVLIAPRAKVSMDIVVYEVHLSIDAGDLPIRAGMTANANLIIANQNDALLIPNRAIIADRKEGKYYVYKVEGETSTKVEVTIGLRDSSHTQIIGGLEEGDKVSIGEIETGPAFGPGSGRRPGR